MDTRAKPFAGCYDFGVFLLPWRNSLEKHPLKYMLLLLAVLLVVAVPEITLAHTGQRGFVMLLPTRLYMFGGGLVVALTFVLTVLLPSGKRSTPLPKNAEPVQASPSLLGSGLVLLFMSLLLLCGYFGSRDPLANPLPLTIWIAWWVGFTMLVALAGNLWARIQPWSAWFMVLAAVPGVRGLVGQSRYPQGLGYWPAVLGFFGFAWIELIYPAPQDPGILANLVLGYALCTTLGLMRFGPKAWLGYGDPFAVFFRMVGWLSPIGWRPFQLHWPGRNLLDLSPLPPSGVAFVVLALATVSFDGLSRTFWWLDLIGENPLEYPGRTDLMMRNTLGLLSTFLVFGFAYLITVRLGRLFGGADSEKCLRRFVLSLIPIAFGYHFAHYLPIFLVEIQYAGIALSDPFGTGLNLLSLRDWHVHASFLTHHQSVEILWYLQVTGIVLAHVCAVVVSHGFASEATDQRRTAMLSQVPATLLMIGYTVFGLWLLSAPVAS